MVVVDTMDLVVVAAGMMGSVMVACKGRARQVGPRVEVVVDTRDRRFQKPIFGRGDLGPI